MSKPKGPQIRKTEEFIPGTYRSGPSGYVPQRVGKYKLNPGGRPDPSVTSLSSRGTYQVEKPKKIGRVHMWILRNPIKFHVVGISLGLTIFFCRPLYDIFIGGSKEGPRPKIERGYSF